MEDTNLEVARQLMRQPNNVTADKIPLRFIEHQGLFFRCEYAVKGEDFILHFFGKNESTYPRKLKESVLKVLENAMGPAGMERVIVEKVEEEAIIGGGVSIFVKAIGFGANLVAVRAILENIPTIDDLLRPYNTERLKK